MHIMSQATSLLTKIIAVSYIVFFFFFQNPYMLSIFLTAVMQAVSPDRLAPLIPVCFIPALEKTENNQNYL